MSAPTLYTEIAATGVPCSNHESDLYVPDTEVVRAILDRYPLAKSIARRFVVQRGHRNAGQVWIDIPFAFQPFWEQKAK